MIFQRTKLLIGEENVNLLKDKHIVVFGVGGVGGFVVEALVRCGIGKLTVVDFDSVDITNLNRQIIATQTTIGRGKVEVIKERALSINPDIEVFTIKERFDKSKKELMFSEKNYDYIVDAIDTVSSKLDLIEISNELSIPIISSMGTGNKINPLMLEVSDIYKTKVCPLAKIMRLELKRRGIKKLKVVYSKELPLKPKNEENSREKQKNIGSISFVPSVAGLIIASEIVKEICKLENGKGC